MRSLFLIVFIVLFFNGCVVRESYYSNEISRVNKSTYSMNYKCSNCSSNEIKQTYDLNDYEEIVYVDDNNVIYVTEEVIYVEENVDDVHIVYIDDGDVNYGNSANDNIIYSEKITYYYEEEYKP